jgi:hypothetical protein
MRLRVLAGALLSVTLVAAPAAWADHPAPGGGTPGTAKNFKLVGHEPLFGRGMNAALTVFGHYVHVEIHTALRRSARVTRLPEVVAATS